MNALKRWERAALRGNSRERSDFLSAVDPWTHQRLENWGRVVRGRVGPRADICATALVCETMARLAGEIDAARLPSMRSDPFDGWFVESVWRGPSMERREKRLLRAYYVLGLPPIPLANAARVPHSEVVSRLLASVDTIQHRLDQTENREYVPPRQFDAPSKDVTFALRETQGGASPDRPYRGWLKWRE